MKTRKSIITSLLISLTGLILVGFPLANQAQMLSADQAYNTKHLQQAIWKFKKKVESDPTNGDALFNLANCYRLNGQFDEAEQWFRNAVQYDGRPRGKLALAQMLMINGNYEEAAIWFRKFADATMDNTSRWNALMLSEQCQRLDGQRTESGDEEPMGIPKDGPLITGGYESYLAGFNSPHLDFSPTWMGENGLLFASNRPSGNVEAKPNDPWTGEKFVDLQVVFLSGMDASAPKPLPGAVNSVFHEGPSTFGPNGNLMYFTRSDFNKGFKGMDKERNTRLKIYSATRIDGGWGNVTELPINNPEFNTCHPALSPDGNFMVLASDRPGGKGGMDLYISKRSGNAWSEPVNLGPKINTIGNEAFPWVSQEGNLYFASDFLVGLGGMDIFKSERYKNKWGSPENLGAPINSSKDDFGYISKDNDRFGFYTSNRSGQDDIYAFNIVQQKILKTRVVNCRDSSVVEGADIQVSSREAEDRTLMTDLKGEAEFVIGGDQAYTVAASKKGYKLSKDCPNSRKIFVFDDQSGNDTTEVVVYLLPENPPPPPKEDPKTPLPGEGPKWAAGTEPPIEIKEGTIIELKNIYFDLDKANIRQDAVQDLEQIVALMKQYPEMTGTLMAHTDCRASDYYNLRLSQRRANSTRQYLIDQGIEPKRITAIGYGETQLKNHCEDNIRCSEAEHQRNRRTEFLINGMGKYYQSSER